MLVKYRITWLVTSHSVRERKDLLRKLWNFPNYVNKRSQFLFTTNTIQNWLYITVVKLSISTKLATSWIHPWQTTCYTKNIQTRITKLFAIQKLKHLKKWAAYLMAYKSTIVSMIRVILIQNMKAVKMLVVMKIIKTTMIVTETILRLKEKEILNHLVNIMEMILLREIWILLRVIYSMKSKWNKVVKWVIKM